MTAADLALGTGAVLGAFLVGAVNPATILARIRGRDIAAAGSGNPGATNAGRVLGARWGVLVGVLDVLKGLLPTLAAAFWAGNHAAYVIGVAAILGHIWSPFLKGRGGKGVATTLGAILGVHPWVAGVVLLVFLVAFALTRWVAVGSMSAALALVALGILVLTSVVAGDTWTGGWLVVLGLVVLLRHRRNVVGWWTQRHLR